MIKMVVFDMAGTTVDEGNVVYKTLQQAINENGFNIDLQEVLLIGAGNEKLQAIKNILKIHGQNSEPALADTIYRRFAIMLERAYQAMHVRPQKNTLELFQALHQKKILVVLNTGYNAVTAKLLVGKLGWREGADYDALITATDVASSRPAPDMILLAMDRFKIKSALEVVKVGDSIIDIEEGKNAGCAMSIGVTTGAHNYEQLQSAKPDYIVHDLLELLPLLTQ